jgi:ankyrin repeat protein
VSKDESWPSVFWPELSEDDWLARLESEPALVTATKPGNFTLLHLAAACGYSTLASALLDSGANPDTLNNEGNWPLRTAIEHGRAEIVDLLLEHRAHPTHPSLSQRYQGEGRIVCDTALTVAALHASLAIVKALVAAGADVNREDVDGWTPLHAAVYGNRVEIVRYLLDQRVDTTVCKRYGRTAAETADNEAAALVRKHQNLRDKFKR